MKLSKGYPDDIRERAIATADKIVGEVAAPANFDSLDIIAAIVAQEILIEREAWRAKQHEAEFGFHPDVDVDAGESECVGRSSR